MSSHTLRYAVEATAASAIGGVVPRLSAPRALAAGRRLGTAWAAMDERHLAIAQDNLQRAFPDWTPVQARAVAKDVYRHFASVLFDILWMSGRSREEILARVKATGGEHVAAAHAGGRGALFVTAHFGNWELHGLAHSWLHGPIGVIARPLDNPALDRRLCAARTRGGNAVIYKRRALAQVLTLLKQGRGVAVLIDQNVQPGDGIFVDFFGRPAATTTVAAALAVKTGCALVPSRAELDADGTYRLVYEEPVLADRNAERTAEVARLTQLLTTRIESWIRGRPEQWLWLHRRWRTQP